MRVGLTSGVFDLVHIGHLRYLERCRSLCDKLIVGVDCDDLVSASKGPERPFIPELQRLDLVRSFSCVDSAFILYRLDDLNRMAAHFKVDLLFKHEGFKKIDKVIGLEHGAKLEIVPDVPGLVSTTEIVAKIRGHQPKIDSPRYEEGDEIRVIDFDNEWHDATLRRVVPIMHECDDEPCRHRIWAAVWSLENTKDDDRRGVTNKQQVWPIGENWNRVRSKS